jgi:two-component system OmpR family response regulator
MTKDETKPHILVIEDARDIREPLARYLREQFYRVTTAADAAAARRVMKGSAIDLVVLDIMMPGEDGLSLCRSIRETSQIPVILLTAKGEEVDRIIGLEMGADDYLPKPFHLRELLARVKSVLRRAWARDSSIHEKLSSARFNGWQLDLTARELTAPSGEQVRLTTGEFDLLSAFVSNANVVLSRDRLLDLARNREAGPFDRTIDVQVGRLRRKLDDDPHQPSLIKTVRGSGYIFTAQVDTN